MVANPAPQSEPAREDTHRELGIPTFLETDSGAFTPVEHCSKGEIAGEVMTLLEQAESAQHSNQPAAHAATHARSLLYEAQALSDYLNV